LKLAGAQNDAMAIGARKAIAALHPDWVNLPFTGCDGLPPEESAWSKSDNSPQPSSSRPPPAPPWIS